MDLDKNGKIDINEFLGNTFLYYFIRLVGGRDAPVPIRTGRPLD
jgi:hypothetical protein